MTVVETTYGPVRGAENGPVTAWKGIRFAAPPVDELRFQAPEPPRGGPRSSMPPLTGRPVRNRPCRT